MRGFEHQDNSEAINFKGKEGTEQKMLSFDVTIDLHEEHARLSRSLMIYCSDT